MSEASDDSPTDSPPPREGAARRASPAGCPSPRRRARGKGQRCHSLENFVTPAEWAEMRRNSTLLGCIAIVARRLWHLGIRSPCELTKRRAVASFSFRCALARAFVVWNDCVLTVVSIVSWCLYVFHCNSPPRSRLMSHLDELTPRMCAYIHHVCTPIHAIGQAHAYM